MTCKRSSARFSLSLAAALTLSLTAGAQTNLALTGTATQSSLDYGGVPERAIDGNTNSVWGNGSITHTADQADSWWQVQLDETYALETIKLYNRSDCCSGRLSNFRTSVFDGQNEVWGADFYMGSGFVNPASPEVITLPAGVVGDRVRVQIYNLNNDGNGFLSLAEVEAFGALGTRYCTAVTNSTSAPAHVFASGSTSISSNSLDLRGGPVPSGAWGVFFYGSDQVQIPFGNGFLCVGPGSGKLYRLMPVVIESASELALSTDISLPPHPSGLIGAGSTWNFQCYYQDAAAGGASFNLTDAIQLQFQP